KLAKPAAVDTMRAYVYESNGTKIAEAILERVGDRGKASISVSAGNGRGVDLVAYDAGRVSWLGLPLVPTLCVGTQPRRSASPAEP
ncbi:MAG: hypothetical protein V1800_05675, partial [Candidatus Latescibacterota bacterium]